MNLPSCVSTLNILSNEEKVAKLGSICLFLFIVGLLWLAELKIDWFARGSLPSSFVHHEGSFQADFPNSASLLHLIQKALPPSFACQVSDNNSHWSLGIYIS